MSLKDRLNAAKSGLQNVQTKVRKETGEEVIERRNTDGSVEQISSKKTKNLGFVPDLTPDLQLCPVTDRIFIGSQDVAFELNQLESAGISHIVNLAYGVPNHFPNRFVYCKIEMLDTPEFDLKSCLDELVRFIDEAILADSENKVFIHCNAGLSRAPTVALAYVMKSTGRTFQDIFDEIRTRRHIQPNPGFMDQLQCLNAALSASQKE